MTVEEQVKKALADPSVIEVVKVSIMKEEGSGFLIYVAQDGTINFGAPVDDDVKKVNRIQHQLEEISPASSTALIVDAHNSIEAFYPYVLNQISRYRIAYQNRPNEFIDRDLGTLILTQWRFNELTDEDNRQIISALSSEGNRIDFSTTVSEPITSDYIALNELKGYHQTPVLVRGDLTDRNSKYVKVTILKQKVPKMNNELLAYASTLDSVGSFFGIDRAAKLGEIFYRRTSGILSLDNRTLTLDTYIL